MISRRGNQPQGGRAEESHRGRRRVPGGGGTNGAGRGPFAYSADEDPGLLALLLRNNTARAQAVDRQIWDQLAKADGWGPGSFFLTLPGDPDRVGGHPDTFPWRCRGVYVVFPSHVAFFCLERLLLYVPRKRCCSVCSVLGRKLGVYTGRGSTALISITIEKVAFRRHYLHLSTSMCCISDNS